MTTGTLHPEEHTRTFGPSKPFELPGARGRTWFGHRSSGGKYMNQIDCKSNIDGTSEAPPHGKSFLTHGNGRSHRFSTSGLMSKCSAQYFRPTSPSDRPLSGSLRTWLRASAAQKGRGFAREFRDVRPAPNQITGVEANQGQSDRPEKRCRIRKPWSVGTERYPAKVGEFLKWRRQ